MSSFILKRAGTNAAANTRDALGHVVNATLGNGLTTVRDYDQARGYINSILTGSTLGTEVQSLSYTWDKVGNLLKRIDQNQNGLTEHFSYDALNRLIEAEVVGASTTMTLTYDAIGNITYKSGVGQYSYGTRPHAVTQITGTRSGDYSYDANGNLVRDEDRALQWTSFNKPRAIVRRALFAPPTGELYDGGNLTYANASAFFYAPDGHRYKQLRNQTLTAEPNRKTILYIGKLYEVQRSSFNRSKQLAYIHAGGHVVAIDVRPNRGPATTQYLHRDHLGSVTAITDPSGELIQRLSYDAFGKRRDDDNWVPDDNDSLLFSAAHTTKLGYTGHEHIDNVGLIHMNGRVYDPIIGRFISPDPLVPSPESTQGLNRYTYVNNNPLSYTDPSGHFALSAVAWIAASTFIAAGEILDEPLLTTVGFAIIGGGATVWYEAAAIGFGAGFTASGGNLEAGAYSAFAALVFYGVGDAFATGDPGSAGNGFATDMLGETGVKRYVAKTVTHGLVGGAFSDLRGGSFSEGFAGAGAAQAFAPAIDSDLVRQTGPAGQVIVAATVGGTASELSGGKFINGASTAAFLMTLRELPSIYEDYVGYELDMMPGGKVVQKTAISPPVEGANNIGIQGLDIKNPCFFCEGGPVSRMANNIFGINAISGVHDTMQIFLGTGFARNVLNIPLMVPAAAFTYAASVGQPLTYLNNSQIIGLSVIMSSDGGDQRFIGALSFGAR